MIEIDLFIFTMSFFIGIYFVYITAPKPNVIIKYPTLKNVNKLKYIDNDNRCYKFAPKEIDCPKKNNI